MVCDLCLSHITHMMSVFECYACLAILMLCFGSQPSITDSYHNLPSQQLSICPAESEDGEKQFNKSVFHLQEEKTKTINTV